MTNATRDVATAKTLATQAEAAAKAEADAKAAVTKAQTEVAFTKTSIDRLKAGQFFTQVYHAREKYLADKLVQDRFLDEAEAATAAVKQAEQQLTASKEELASLPAKIKKLEAMIKDAAQQAAAAKAAADKLTAPSPLKKPNWTNSPASMKTKIRRQTRHSPAAAPAAPAVTAAKAAKL